MSKNKKIEPVVIEHDLKLLRKIFPRNTAQKLACVAWFELNETFSGCENRWDKAIKKACNILNVDFEKGNQKNGYENGVEACFNKMKGNKKLSIVGDARAWVIYLATKCDLDGGREFEKKMLEYYDVIYKKTGVEW